MSALINLVGKMFGRWAIIAPSEHRGSQGETYWFARCTCGREKLVMGRNLRDGRSRSCGCVWLKHGHTAGGKRSRAYACWVSARQRCNNPRDRNYSNYGGRGIKFYKPWDDDFRCYLRDTGEPPPGMSIDRINNDGNYEPGNVRWTTCAEQNRNRRPPKRKRQRANVADVVAFAASLARAAGRSGDEKIAQLKRELQNG
jgi:anti-sigma28 factor (negative regulator of flagellin synthesis)